MDIDWPGACYDHYERFLGKAANRESYRLDGTSLQILRYDGVFDGCSVLCTVGFAHFSRRRDPTIHEEVVMAVDCESETAGRLLAMTLFYIGNCINAVPVLGSKGGIHELDGEFVKKYHKDAIYFTEPFPFPKEFADCRCTNLIGKIYLAVFIDAKEHEFLKTNGAGALEEMLEKGNADPFCLGRPSVV